jgi:DNA-binding NarL/FixJ family response regulator
LKIFIVEDHPIVRKGISQILIQNGFDICGEAENCNAAFKDITSIHPDLVILDLSLGPEEGFQLVKLLRENHSHVSILIFSMHEDTFHVQQALNEDVDGYVTKQEVMDVLVEAIHSIRTGKRYFSQRITDVLAEQIMKIGDTEANFIKSFNKTEKQIYKYLGQGYSLGEIANEVCLSPKSIERYLKKIKEKLCLKHTRDLLRHAIKHVSKIE